MIDVAGLAGVARLLLGEDNKAAPSQARLRRAVSTAYYILFHALVRTATDGLVGARNLHAPRYETVYRSFDHARMKEACASVDKPILGARAQKGLGRATPAPEIRAIASAFVTLQERRHWADYSPVGKITQSEARDLVDLAILATRQLKKADQNQLWDFLAYLLLSVRS